MKKMSLILAIAVLLQAIVPVLAIDSELAGAAGTTYDSSSDNPGAGILRARDIQNFNPVVPAPQFTRLCKEADLYMNIDVRSFGSSFDYSSHDIDQNAFGIWLSERATNALVEYGPVNLNVMEEGEAECGDLILNFRAESAVGESSMYSTSEDSEERNYGDYRRDYSSGTSHDNYDSTATTGVGAYVTIMASVSELKEKAQKGKPAKIKKLFAMTGTASKSSEVQTSADNVHRSRSDYYYARRGKSSSSSKTTGRSSGFARDPNFEAFQLLDRLYGQKIDEAVRRLLFAWQVYEQKQRLKGVYEREDLSPVAQRTTTPRPTVERVGKNGIRILR